jgi:hypothetical protein
MKLDNLTIEDLNNIVIVVKYKTVVTPLLKYTITHMIRKIHDGEKFGMTESVIETLKEYGLFETETISKSQRTKFNRLLKKLGFNDEIMIEHMISVKTIVEGLFKLQLDGTNDESIVREYLESNTNCIIKLKHLEKELHG